MKSKATVRIFAVTILGAALSLCGCESSSQTSNSGTGTAASASKDQVARAYAELKSGPVPYPNSTPFDSDPRLKGAYVEGFNVGWDSSIRGEVVYGVSAVPSSKLAADLSNAWTIGWREGARRGTDKLAARLKDMK